jgi:YHS domain-containing protein
MHHFRLATMLVAFAALAPLPAVAAPVWTGLLGTEAAVGGYDSVSYFTGRPLVGSDAFTTQYKGANFKFANARNLATFKANPARYAPQYGGHCAWAAANNYRFAGDPKVWKIVDGKLYLNYNKSVQAKWEQDIPALVTRGDANWVALGK